MVVGQISCCRVHVSALSGFLVILVDFPHSFAVGYVVTSLWDSKQPKISPLPRVTAARAPRGLSCTRRAAVISLRPHRVLFFSSDSQREARDGLLQQVWR